MTITVGEAPFGHKPAGRFNFDTPRHVVYVEPFPRRVRAQKGGTTVVDSERVKLVHESGELARFAFPREDVKLGGDEEPHIEGYVRVPWDEADAWFEEDEQVYVHPRDPYHRVEVFATSRRVRILLNGQVLADSIGTKALYETGLPARYYFPMEDVRTELLEPSTTFTQCAYKGSARHWSARVGDEVFDDVAWMYQEDVRREGEPVRGRIAFYNERTDVEIDGVAQERPRTPWYRA